MLSIHRPPLSCLRSISLLINYAPDLEDEVRGSEALLWRAWKDRAVLGHWLTQTRAHVTSPAFCGLITINELSSLGPYSMFPLTDADLVNFTPYDPTDSQPLDFDFQNDSLDVPEGPPILTFTFKLSFTLGIEDSGHTDLAAAGSWADPDDIANFGKTPIVRVRQHNEPTDGIEFSPTRDSNALQEFFGDLDESVKEVQFAAIPDAYEQWVTPSGRLASEDPDDDAYAFHRALLALNTFLTGLDLAVSDIRISSVSTTEIGPVVFLGAWPQDGNWVPTRRSSDAS